jgi:hypothetical protein
VILLPINAGEVCGRGADARWDIRVCCVCVYLLERGEDAGLADGDMAFLR